MICAIVRCIPICFSALCNVEPSTMKVGLRPRSFSAYKLRMSVEPGVKFSTKNDGVTADEFATNFDSSSNTSSMNCGDKPPSKPGKHSTPSELLV